MDDAFYSLNLEPIRRSDGRDSVAAVAYILGESIRNDARPHGYSSFTHQRDRVIATGRAMPTAVPDWAQDISTVWNRNEKVNNRKNSQLGQRIIVALPHEIDPDKRVAVVAEFAAYLVQSYGVLVEYALHIDEGENNPHAHLIFTDRKMTAEGFGAKVRAFARKKFYYEIRDKWAEIGNAALAASGSDKRLNPKSYKARGIERTPTQHRGYAERGRASPEVIEQQEERQIIMSREPTAKERFKYPNIAHLEFPPRIEDAKEGIERQEVERFYTDQGQPVPKVEVQDEREFWDGSLPDMMDAPEKDQREYQQYLDEQAAKRDEPEYDLERTFQEMEDAERERFIESSDPRIDRANLDAQRRQQAEQDYRDLRARARNMHAFMPEHEQRVMDRVKDAPADVQDYYKEQIIVARMKELQAQDFETRQKELDRVIMETTRAHERREAEERYIEHDEPERER